MTMEKESHCYFCNSKCDIYPNYEDESSFIACPVCGRYSISLFDLSNRVLDLKGSRDKIAAYLYHRNKLLENERPEEYVSFIGAKEHYDGLLPNHPNYHHVTMEEVKAFWPHRFADRIDRILQALSLESRFFGDNVYLSFVKKCSLMFIKRNYADDPDEEEDANIEADALCDYLDQAGYANYEPEGNEVNLTLIADGWNRVEEIQRSDLDNKDIFVAISFADSAIPTREAIKAGIIKAGFSPEFMDEMIHNKEIVPEMFRLIRECRLLIMDISEPNYGAYYEAGYALGQGKEVIISCSAETYNRKYESDEEKKYARYLKPHFDIAQKQILIWNDYDDLTNKICEWIKALIR